MKKTERMKCFFCSSDLENEPKEEIIQTRCCGIYCHKRELYSRFKKKITCPNCRVFDKQTHRTILNWGVFQKKKKKRHDNNKEFKKWLSYKGSKYTRNKEKNNS